MVHRLQAQFNQASSRLASKRKAQDHDNDVSMLMGKGATSNRVTMLSHTRAVEEKKKKQAFEDFLFQLTYLQILQTAAKIKWRMAEAISSMVRTLAAMDGEIENIQDRLKAISARHRELNDAIEAEYVSKDEDGHYVCKAVEDTVKAYTQRTGQTLPDDLSADMLIMLLLDQQTYEVEVVIPSLKKSLHRFNRLRDNVQEKALSLEAQLSELDEQLSSIDNNDQMNDEAKKLRTIRVLEQASHAVLDAEMAARPVDKEFTVLVDEVRSERWQTEEAFFKQHSKKENADLYEAATSQLNGIKPIIP